MTTTSEQLREHKIISSIKSALRIAGCIVGIIVAAISHSPGLAVAFTGFFIAEGFGIIEEMVVD